MLEGEIQALSRFDNAAPAAIESVRNVLTLSVIRR